jgi:hypothetical protein
LEGPTIYSYWPGIEGYGNIRKLKQKKCLVVDCIEDIHDRLAINGCDIDIVVQQTDYIYKCIDRIINDSFIVLTREPTNYVELL